MTKEEAYRYIDNLKWLKGYDNTTIGGKTVGEILDEIKTLLKEQEAVELKQVRLYGKEDWYGLVCVCPDCKAVWMSGKSETHFCPNCGQALKWG